MKPRGLVACVSIAILVLLPFVSVEACGPDFQPDIFVRAAKPDNSQAFAQGHLGILQKGFNSDDLSVAYRYLNGGTLSREEQDAYAPPRRPVRDWSTLTPQEIAEARKVEQDRHPVNTWKNARALYVTQDSTADQHKTETDNGSYGSVYYNPDYLNCPDNAFRTAALTLDARARTWGKQSMYLVDWIRGQDAVFSNCDGKSASTPGALPADAPMLLRADRTYQLAAAAFYAGRYDEALLQFEAIAKEKDSPWRALAPYLAARTLVRKSFFLGKKTDPWSGDLASFDPATMQSAQKMLEEILQRHDPAISNRTIEEELNFVRMRTEPDKRLTEISEALAGPGPDRNFRQDLHDLSYVLYKKIPVASAPPLVEWIDALRTSDTALALSRWHGEHSLQWLTAAVMSVAPTDNSVDELLSAAAKIERDSPAYETIVFHRARLMMELHREEEARALLDHVLTGVPRGTIASNANAFRGQRMAVARNFDEFLQYAPRTLLEALSEGSMSMPDCTLFANQQQKPRHCMQDPNPLKFDEDSVAVFNRQLPLDMLAKAAFSPNLPSDLRREIAMAAWVRSVLLNDPRTAAMLAPLLPDSIHRVAGGSSGFPATLAMLRNPGLRPYVEPGISRLATYDVLEELRDNWWGRNWQRQYYSDNGKPNPPKTASFLTEEQLKIADKQYQTLVQLPYGPAYLGQRAVEHAKQHPDDPDVPEVLALTVRATHFGWVEWSDDPDGKSQNTAVSKAAFQLLHSRYPRSPWTARTPYYY